MWMVFNHEDSWECGYSVASESEAMEICNADPSMMYMYIGISTLTYAY